MSRGYFSQCIKHMKQESKFRFKERGERRRLLKNNHKEFIENLMSGTSWQRWTCSRIKSELKSNFEGFPSLHNSAILRWLHSQLGWSYKKLEKKPAPSFVESSYRLFLEGVLIQKLLYQAEVELIYIDEFSVNTRQHEFKGWGKKENKNYIKVGTDNFSMSFLWAVSAKRVFGLMGVNGTTNLDGVIIFFKSILRDPKQK